MAVQEDNSMYVPQPSPYGKIIREKGTQRLVAGAILMAIGWYAYSTVHTNLMFQVKWPALSYNAKDLTVIGLQDKDRPGFRHKYQAREVNHAWQIRYNDDQAESQQPEDPSEVSKDEQKFHNNPSANHGDGSGGVVPFEELIANSPVALVGKHFAGADIEQRIDPMFERKYYRVNLDLTEEGRSRYWQFSSRHDKERLAFILGGEVITCPRMENLDVSSLTIEPIWIKADAERLMNFINGQKK